MFKNEVFIILSRSFEMQFRINGYIDKSREKYVKIVCNRLGIPQSSENRKKIFKLLTEFKNQEYIKRRYSEYYV